MSFTKIASGASVQQAQKHVGNKTAIWKALNNNGTLHHEDFIKFAEDSVEYRQFENVVVADLMEAGLSEEASITDTLVHFQTVNEFEANVSMNGSNKESQQTDYADSFIPLPIFTAPFSIPFRQGGFAYKNRDGMMAAYEAVNEMQDQVMIKGASLGVMMSGKAVPLYGFTNHPSTITSDISDWANPSNSDAIANEAVGLMAKLWNGAKTATPNTVMMYVATDIWGQLEADYSSQKGDRTVLERIRAISAIKDVKPQKDLEPGDVLLVEMRARTVTLPIAQQAIAVPHMKENDLDDGKFTVYSAMTPKIKTDRSGATGILYASKA